METTRKKNWEFYFELEDGRRTYFEKECIAPSRTKIWKSLNDYLMNEEVVKIGFGVKPKNRLK
jgi:hypothetical protein